MYLKNDASPKRIFAGVVNASTGEPISGGVTIKHYDENGTQTTGDNSANYELNGTWSYVPSQAETNYTSFAIKFYHTDAVGNGPLVQVVTTTINPDPTDGAVESDVVKLGGDTQSLTDLKDFVDAGYDPATNQVEGVKLTNTVTGNITGNLSGSVGSVTGAVGSVTADVTTDAASRTATADAVLSRNASNVEGTMPEHCLGTVILAALEWQFVDGTLTIYRTDGSTTHATKTGTVSDTAQSVTKLT